MPMKDSISPDHPLPLFLSRPADQYEPRGSSRLLKVSILVMAATVSGIAIAVSLGNPVKLFADVTASLTDIPAPLLRTDQSTRTIQPTAVAQALPPPARGVSTRGEIVEQTDQSQTESGEAPGALLQQFQAWAAKEDAPARVVPEPTVQNAPVQVEPVRPSQDARAQLQQDDRAPDRPIHRRLRRVQNARAEIRNPRARIRLHQNARVDVRPAQDARAQDQSVQNAQPPSFLESLGFHN